MALNSLRRFCNPFSVSSLRAKALWAWKSISVIWRKETVVPFFSSGNSSM